MSKEVKVSVLTPIYNHNIEYVKQCLASLKSQTMQEIEFILIDNGAVQEAKDLIAEYEKIDSRFKVIHIPKNLGYGHAMNKGLKEAKGEYIGIVESDDMVKPIMYEKMYLTAEKYDVDIVKALFSYYDSTSGEKVCKLFQPEYYNKVLAPSDVSDYCYKYGSYWSAIYRKELLTKNEIKYEELPRPSAEDVMFTLKTFFACNRLYILSDSFYLHRLDNPNSSIHTKDCKVWNCYKLYNMLDEYLNARNIPIEFWYIKNKREYLNFYYSYYFNDITKNKLSYLYAYSKKFKKNLKEKKVNLSGKELKSYKKLAYHPLYFMLSFRHKNEKYNNSILENIFSVKNSQDGRKKVVCLLGVKIKFYFNKKNILQSIFSVKNSVNKKHKIISILGLKIKLKNPKFVQNGKTNEDIIAAVNRTYYLQKSNMQASIVHKSTFASYDNLYRDNEVVIVASGPTSNYYDGINQAIHIGVNRSFLNKKVDLDYLFVQDHLEGDMEGANCYRQNLCTKFYGILPELRYNQVKHLIQKISHQDIIKANAKPYIIEDGVCRNWAQFLEYEPIGDWQGCVFSALQFALYTNPKKLYLVGCDCNDSGHFYAEKDTKFVQNNTRNLSYQKKSWVRIKNIIEMNYPDTEVISVNPVGLRGMFRDVYTQSYVDEHPELLNENVEIINKENCEFNEVVNV